MKTNENIMIGKRNCVGKLNMQKSSYGERELIDIKDD